MLKKILYCLMIFSYLVVGFILIYTNKINSDYNETIFRLLTVCVIAIWLIVPVAISHENEKKTEPDTIETVLKTIADLPLFIVAFIPCLILFPFFYVSSCFRWKVRALLRKGFVLKKEKKYREKIYYLIKDNVVIKIREFDLYEISDDFGNTYESVKNTKLLSDLDKDEFNDNLLKYNEADYRDKDFYDPTRKLAALIAKM